MQNNLHINTIIPNLKAGNAKQVFQKLSAHVSNMIGVSQKELYRLLVKQEDSLNSGVGHGVAIAHAKLPRLTRPIILYARLEQAVHFDAADGELVDMVAVVLSPEFETAPHLQRLATVTRFFTNYENRLSLQQATDYESIRRAIDDIQSRKKAA